MNRPTSMKDLFGDTPFALPQPPVERAFDGDTYEPDRDHERLSGQLQRVYELMRDEHWRTLEAISRNTGGTEASVSARLRDLRKDKYGAHVVERRHVVGGLWEYKMRRGA
jgi:hypothetical protein